MVLFVGVIIRFAQNQVTADEGAVAPITLEKVGGSDLPVQVMVNTEDNTGIGKWWNAVASIG